MIFPTILQNLFTASSDVSIVSATNVFNFSVLKDMGKVTGSKSSFSREHSLWLGREPDVP